MSRNVSGVPSEPLRVLLIEDNPGDARLIREMFQEATDSPKVVIDGDGSDEHHPFEILHDDRLSTGLETLATDEIDVTLLDLNLPDSRGLDTLTAVQEEAPSIPTIVLTGLANREIGIQALQQGTEEFLVKDEINPTLLARSVFHAIERHAQERELIRYETLIEESTDVNVILDEDGTFTYVTPSAEYVLGYNPDELEGESAYEYIHPDDREEASRALRDLVDEAGDRPRLEFRFRHADDSWVWLESRGRNMLDDPVLDGIVVYTRDVTDRKAYEQELEQYETLIEESTDVNAILDPDGTFRYLTPSVEHVLGYEQDELTGEVSFDYIHPDDRDEAMEEFFLMVEDPDYRPRIEFRFEHADGSWVVLEARGRNLLDDQLVDGLVAYTRDVTERKQHEIQLSTLNDLNEIFQESIEDLVESDDRETIEQAVCDHLVESGLYDYAWVGAFDTGFESMDPRVDAGISTDDGLVPEILGGIESGPSIEAAKAGETRVERNLRNEPGETNWRSFAVEYGFDSMAAIPIRYDEALYGVLTLYTARPDAFEGHERAIVSRFGNVIGHAIAAIERKHALTTEEVVEVEFNIDGVPYGSVSLGENDRIQYERTVPLSDGQYLSYGTVTRGAFEALRTIAEEDPATESVWIYNEDEEESRFEMRLNERSLVALVANRNGQLTEATIENDCYQFTVRLPPSSDTRELFETVQELFPEVELVAQRRTTRDTEPFQLSVADLVKDLTDRQRTALESAYSAGYFEWPRERNGEEIAETMAISPSTFHQHLRAGERKLLGSLFTDS